jgi:hypothetical protein
MHRHVRHPIRMDLQQPRLKNMQVRKQGVEEVGIVLQREKSDGIRQLRDVNQEDPMFWPPRDHEARTIMSGENVVGEPLPCCACRLASSGAAC